MNCKEIKNYIQKYLNKEIDIQLLEVVKPHFQTCPSCEKEYKRALALRTFLNEDKEENCSLPNNFDQALHMKLVQANEEKRNKKTSSFFSFGKLALSLGSLAAIIFIVVTIFQTKVEHEVSEDGTLISRSAVPSGQPVVIHLEYNAAKEIKDVKFTLSLDKGLSFKSTIAEVREKRIHTWKGDLKKGVNKIPFVVNVYKKGKMKINTHADFEGFRHNHRMILNASKDKVQISYYVLPKTKINNDV